MKRLSILVLLISTLLVPTKLVPARESHAGRPDKPGTIATTGRESHAGKPTSPGIGIVSGPGGRRFHSRLGPVSPFGGTFSLSPSSWPVFTPVPLVVPGTAFQLFLFIISGGPARLY